MHMSRQLSCRDMCKIVIWLDHQNRNQDKYNFYKISSMNSLTIYEIGQSMHNPWM